MESTGVVSIMSVDCSSYSAYSANSSYGQGSRVVYNGWLSTAKWPVPPNKPPGSSGMVESSPGYYTYESYWGYSQECTVTPPEPTPTQYPPSLQAVFPLSGMLISSRTPLLGAKAVSNMSSGYAITYSFKVCTNAALSTGCVSSGTLGSNVRTWRVPTANALAWSTQYWWKVTATDTSNSLTTSWTGTFTTGVRQPAVGSRFSRSGDGRAIDPANGNYTASSVDASVAAVGPSLAVVRTYNSLDPRRDTLFGAGWSTRWDMRLTPEGGTAGNPAALLVRNPDGRQVRFATNNDATGTFQPPPGMYATLAVTRDTGGVVTGWQLMDKAATSFFFDLQGRLVKIADARGRTQTLEYGTNGKLARATNPGGRWLAFTWTGSHVTSVATNPVDGASLTWTYTYDGDKLLTACSPIAADHCTTYTYASGSQYASAVRNSDPLGYWRLGEASGTKAADSGWGAGEATYAGVTLGQAGAVEASTDKAASFAGAGSVTLPDHAIAQLEGSASVEAWFKTTQTGVVWSAGTDNASNPARSALYVGTDGKLRGQFRSTTGTAAIAPITSTALVNDGQWHHAVLTLSGTSQQLFLDGQSVGTATGSGFGGWPVGSQLARGRLEGGAWPAGPATTTTLGLNGTLDEAALYDRPLTADEVAIHFAARAAAPHLMSKITLPSGLTWMQVTYDAATDRVKTHTDEHGGVWQLSAPTLTAASGVATVTLTDPADNTIDYELDAHRGYRLISRKDQLDKKISHTYNTAGFPTQTADANGNLVTRSVDTRGNLLSTTTCRAVGNCQTTRTEYYLNTGNVVDPRNDRPTKIRDARSLNATDNTYATTLTYTAFGEAASQTSPATADFPSGRTVSTTYSDGSEPAIGGGFTPAGLAKAQTDARGSVWSYAYTAAGDLAEQTDPNGLVTKLVYDSIGRLVTSRQISAAHPGGVTTSYAYDRLSRLVSQTGPGVRNELTDITHTAQTRYTYDADGHKLTETLDDLTGGDAERTTTYAYDTAGRLKSVTGPEGGTVQQVWNTHGQLVRTTDARNTVLEQAYSKRGELTTTTLKAWTGSPWDPQPAADVVLQALSYDPAGRLASRTDAVGRKTAFTYYADNLLYERIAEDAKLNGSTTARDVVLEAHSYDAAGNETKLVTGGGRLTTDYVYDAASRRTSQTADPAGVNRKTAYTYDAANNVIKTVLTGAGSTRIETREYAYTTTNLINRETVDNGDTDLTTTRTYDDRGLLTSTVDPRGNVSGATAAAYTTTLRYDTLGRLVEATAPPVQVDKAGTTSTVRPAVHTGYNTAGQPTHQRDAEGRTAVSAYDRAGRLTSTATPSYTPPGGTAVTPAIQHEYDSAGQLVKTTDPRGYATTFHYDALGRLVWTTEPEIEGEWPGQWVAEYDLVGRILAVTDPIGARTEATYDDLNRQITYTEIEHLPAVAAYTTRLEYNDAGQLTKSTDPRGKITSLTVNPVGDTTKVVDPLLHETLMAYDLAGRPSKITDPLGNATAAEYDLAGRMTALKDLGPTGTVLRTTAYGHDPAGNLTSFTSPEGPITQRTFDALGRITSLIEPVSASKTITTSFGYDATGTRTRLTDGRGNTTWTSYNSLALPESVTEPATTAHPSAADRTWTTIYDAAGNPVASLRPGGVRVDRTFDHLGRLTAETGQGAGAATADRTISYDRASRPIKLTSGTSQHLVTYNDRRLPAYVAEIVDGTYTRDTSYTYDQTGRMLQRSNPAGPTTFTWDAAGRLETATDPVTGRTLTYGYDNANRLTSMTGKTSTGTTTDSQSFTYDPLNRLTGQTLKNATGTQLAAITYAWDKNDRLTTKTTAGLAGAGVNTYGYDQAGRLTSWSAPNGTVTDYGWDDSGNRIEAGDQTFTYDERNRLLNATGPDGTANGAATYGYTPRGTLATETKNGQATHLTFDAFDRLIADGDSVYSYDALDRINTRTRGTIKQAFAYSGLTNNLAGIVNTDTGGVDARYGRDASGGLLGLKEGAGPAVGALTDLHTDLVATFTTSALATSTTYDPFGDVLAQTGAKNTLGYQGEYTDPDTGKVNMHARWYTPGTGTFASRDSWTLNPYPSGRANRYAYANASPVVFTDPSGHAPPQVPDGSVGSCWYEDDYMCGDYPSPTGGGSNSASSGSGGTGSSGSSGSGGTTTNPPQKTPKSAPNTGGNGNGGGGSTGAGIGQPTAPGKPGGKGGNGTNDGSIEGEVWVPPKSPPILTNRTNNPKSPNYVPPPQVYDGTGMGPSRIIPISGPGWDSPIWPELCANIGHGLACEAPCIFTQDGPCSGGIDPPDPCLGGGCGYSGAPDLGACAFILDGPCSIAYDIDPDILDGPGSYDDGCLLIIYMGCNDDTNYDEDLPPTIWMPFRDGVDNTPQGDLPPEAGIPARSRLKPGGYHFIVRPDGTVRLIDDESMWDLTPDAGHTSLADREGVIMAGTLDVDEDGKISHVDNFSGHYAPEDRPGKKPLKDITREALQEQGWGFDDDAWDYFERPPR
ncbi:hypothetical protein GCM10022248_93950 [Nonomuraea soli]